MRVIENERTVFIDVDDTLVMHKSSCQTTGLLVVDPATGNQVEVYKNAPMIKCLLEERHRGAFIVVWSMGGYEWARNVLQALGIDGKVDLVMSKPFAYFDDKPVEQWLKYRVYIEPDTAYKRS